MGQYYRILNLDKKEYLSPYDFGCTAKLMEFSYIAKNLETNNFLSTVVALMQTEWKNDRIVFIGNYADYAWAIEEPKGDNAKYFFRALSTEPGFEYLSKEQGTLFEEYYSLLYDADKHGFTKRTTPTIAPVPQYLCNRHTKEYIDLKSLMVEWRANNKTGDENAISIFPLPLLLAVGNGLGLGDYNGANKEYVGSWLLTAGGVYFSNTVPNTYQEYPIIFSEVL